MHERFTDASQETDRGFIETDKKNFNIALKSLIKSTYSLSTFTILHIYTNRCAYRYVCEDIL